MAIEIVKTINGVKQLVPLTTDSGQGLPLGAITAFYGTTPPNGYLICDGSEFSTTDYPALYTFLGDNHTPDLRECTLVGVGQNSSDTIADHDVYTLGEFKDDQVQIANGKNFPVITDTSTGYGIAGNPHEFSTTYTGRKGTTTHGKQKGVNYIIKAVIGPIEDSAADQVVQTITNNVEEVVSYYGEQWTGNQSNYTTTFNETPKKGKYQVSIVIKGGSTAPSCGGYILNASSLSDDNMPNLCGANQASALNILSAQFSQLVYFDGNTNTLTFDYLFSSNNARIQITKVS